MKGGTYGPPYIESLNNRPSAATALGLLHDVVLSGRMATDGHVWPLTDANSHPLPSTLKYLDARTWFTKQIIFSVSPRL